MGKKKQPTYEELKAFIEQHELRYDEKVDEDKRVVYSRCASKGCKEHVHSIFIITTKIDPKTGISKSYGSPVCDYHAVWLHEQLEKGVIEDWQKVRKDKKRVKH